MLLKQSTSRVYVFFMADSTDLTAGKAGLTSFTIKISKNGGTFTTISPTVTSLGEGWYKLTLTTTDTNTLGQFSVQISASGAVTWRDQSLQIVAALPGEVLSDVILEDIADTVLNRRMDLAIANAGTTGGGNATVVDKPTLIALAQDAIGKVSLSSDVKTVYEPDGTTVLLTITLTPAAGSVTPYTAQQP